ncbi:helix-turn-helix domain-containing protein [Salmonella enterica subsp. enterica serovar Beaudesert]|nr:helix-turn-helix domain-containing protein [Salmonella enterica]ECF2430157.1 helix-turn-helix domain-containing protein [Salmonella enterica subsp. enterica serovar Beaudesert]EAY5155587.1 helix-turn-helix domain-containing protein [Salmonella enterica]EAZ4585917.1 helix-turn-helix domain-containing protein [Salmonella enterica]EBK4144647.1 endodeoxyribonuclease [Salmonella enterica]
MLSETAKDIAGYEGKYSVTTDGRVYSHSRVDACGRLQKGRWLKPVNHSDGYLYVNLRDKGTLKKHYIHRVVAAAFIDNPNSLPQVNHINGIKSDNRVDNLEWVTGCQNMVHASKSGLLNPISGERHYCAKLTTEQVKEIRACKSMSQREMARMYGVSKATIAGILNNKTWIMY